MKKAYIIGGIVLLIFLLAGGILYELVVRAAQPTTQISSAASSTPQATDYVPKSTGRAVPAGQLEYYTQKFGFSLLYPDTLKVQEFAEEGGGQTTTFQYDDGKTVVGFQIYVAPFSGTQITEERFKQDEPSGVRTGLKNITVDGATGASFYSKNDLLGDTAEVWFIHGGYLYEVTTFKEEAQWLSDILATWKFVN
jgi:hypothetical protein